jgi:hypothetical protein
VNKKNGGDSDKLCYDDEVATCGAFKHGKPSKMYFQIEKSSCVVVTIRNRHVAEHCS